MKPLRTAVIGAGHQGKYHAAKYASLPDARLVCVVDTDRTRGDELARQYSADYLNDYRGLIGHVDAVSIAVPTAAHFEIARNCLENHIHVLLEKPITSTLEEATRLIRLAEEQHLVLQIGHLERFNSAILAVEQYARKPRFIESYRIAPFKERGTDINVILDLMIHDIDLILGIVNSPIQQLDANGTPVISKHVDIANARIRFANGCVANVTASRVSRKSERRIRIFQDDTYMSVDMLNSKVAVYQKDTERSSAELPGIAVEEMTCEKGDALKLQIQAFIESITQGKPPVVTGEAGKQALETAIRISELVSADNRDATTIGVVSSRR
jgi:predicted dehydrogenase